MSLGRWDTILYYMLIDLLNEAECIRIMELILLSSPNLYDGYIVDKIAIWEQIIDFDV